MAKEAYVRTVDLQSGNETEDGPFLTESAAYSFAESRAEEYFGGDEVTWFEPGGDGSYHVGRIADDGARSDPIVTITVEDREVEAMEGLGL